MEQIPRLRRTKTPRAAGYTLVEVVIAMLLTSVMVTSVFSVALTAKGSGGKGERKLKAAAGAKQVAGQLANYVTGDESAGGGPGSGAGADSWSMTSGGIQDHGSGTCTAGSSISMAYALSPGLHCLTGVLGAFENAPYNARVKYTVVHSAIVNGRPLPSVSINTTWDEP